VGQHAVGGAGPHSRRRSSWDVKTDGDGSAITVPEDSGAKVRINPEKIRNMDQDPATISIGNEKTSGFHHGKNGARNI